MRLIDADALINECDSLIKVNATSNRYIDLIKNAPTVEPERKRGEWVDDDDIAKCPFCKTPAFFHYGWELTNFCSECGADLRKEAEE